MVMGMIFGLAKRDGCECVGGLGGWVEGGGRVGFRKRTGEGEGEGAGESEEVLMGLRGWRAKEEKVVGTCL